MIKPYQYLTDYHDFVQAELFPFCLVTLNLLVELTKLLVTKFLRADPSVTCPVSNSIDFQKNNSSHRNPSEIWFRLSTVCRNFPEF